MNKSLVLILCLFSLNSFASELILCEVSYLDQQGVTNLSGSFHKVGEFNVQDCSKQANQTKLTVDVAVTFEFTHFTQAASLSAPGAGWKLSSTYLSENKAPASLSYSEF